ncbi:MAG TPA: hypothetical protein VFC74_06360 [Oscillospiraceae bacterium]|nr:hypothetical protein [Oscillospiraceae bacterium]
MLQHKVKLALLMLALLLLTACGPPNPELTVQDYWQAVVNGNAAEAAAYIQPNEATESWLKKLWPDNSAEFVDDAKTALFLQRITITPTSHEINGSQATVNVTVTWPQLDNFLGNFMTEALSEVFSLALSHAAENEIDAALETIFTAVLVDTPDTHTEHVVKLVLEEGKWKLTSSPLPDPAVLFNLQAK